MLLHLQGVTRLREPILNLQGISQRETEQLPYLAMPSSAFLNEYAKDHHRPTVVSTSSLKDEACSLMALLNLTDPGRTSATSG